MIYDYCKQRFDSLWILRSNKLVKEIKINFQIPVRIITILSVPDSAPNTSPGLPSN